MATNLFDQVSDDIRKAMLARDKVRLEALRGIKKEFLEAKTAKGANGELSDDTALKIIVKMVKQRKESADIYTSNGRPELAANELAEAAVIEEYLPKQLSAEELDKELRDIIAEVGATGPAQMGKVMGVASKRLAGRAEGKAINAAVREILNTL
ncbi:MAG: GatB/YqeY domain-containing protein [Muribaculaceae bacterium]|nr:GatB/YqeY domain-containing protein [Muribaculaceae bacterium]MDE7081404.1 GatB/YqeY domain-containing protein [Muribaculaceae bacterium]